MKDIIFAVVAIVAIAGAGAYPRTALDQLFQRRQASADCQGDPSDLIIMCMMNLESLEHPSSGLPLDQVSTPEELDYVCNELQASTACVKRVHDECGHREDMLVSITYQTMQGVVGHMCSPEGREVILAEADCWSDKILERDIERCSEQQAYGPPCSILSRARRCINNAVDRRCSDRAAQFMDELLYYGLKPMADAMQCNMQLRVSRSLLKALPMVRKESTNE